MVQDPKPIIIYEKFSMVIIWFRKIQIDEFQ